ncbi:MAG: hypothetical protein KC964_16530 [Candidatus Omnitrophica bacterium]|nr:hypothetical protein [Candidatus Omnitrophota bacterium]
MPTTQHDLFRYDIAKSYDWNYENAPDPVDIEVPDYPGEWDFMGIPTGSPLGMPAGPLLNGKWVLYYASLGFDVLTYKTVRTRERACYDLPNLQPVDTESLHGGESECPTTHEMTGSWAVSFGMPSKAPDVWREDVETTRKKLPKGKVLSVSVVGSVLEGWGIEELAADYARCAKWAVDSGADVVETNFSCPNVSSPDGQLYQQHEDARFVAKTVRQAIGDKPYLIKVGHVPTRKEADWLIRAVGPYVDGLAMTNSVATKVRDEEGNLLFEGQCRGICGKATLDESLKQVGTFHEIIQEKHHDLKLIGVGGASTAEDVQSYLDQGAHSVHIATAAMVDPEVAIRIRESAGSL